jgi:TonB family protein
MAQHYGKASIWFNVKYVNRHLFMQKDSDFNVVDLQLEWPETIDNVAVDGLRQALASLLNVSATDADSISNELLASYGQPITRQLKALPDDRRFCYANYSVKMKSYEPNRYIAFEVRSKVEPYALSSVMAESNYAVVTYDMQRKQCLYGPDLLKAHNIQQGLVDPSFLDTLFASLDDDTYFSLTAESIDAAWPDSDRIGFHISCTTPEKQLSYETTVRYEDMRNLVTKEGRRLIERKIQPLAPEFRPLSLQWQGDSICQQPDSLAHFTGGLQAMRNYMSHMVKPQNMDAQGRVLVATVINKKGEINDVRVVKHLSPGLDRYAAKVVADMPKWVPGTKNGQPVTTRVVLPFTFK